MRMLAVAAVLAVATPLPAEATVLFTGNESFFIADTGAALLPVDPLVGPNETRILNGPTPIGGATFTATPDTLSAVGANVVTRYGQDFLRLSNQGSSLTINLAQGSTAFGFRLGGTGTTFSGQICADELCLFTFPPTTGTRFFGFKDTAGLQTVRMISGSQNFDLSAIRLAGTAVPEPSAWVMLIAGFGLVGFALRRDARPARPALA
jgi:hypothetical protein